MQFESPESRQLEQMKRVEERRATANQLLADIKAAVRRLERLRLVLLAVVALTACTPNLSFLNPEVTGPQVTIVDPANQSTVGRGGTVRIRALIDDPEGIASIQLVVNGQAARTEIPTSPPVTQLTQDLFWTPDTVGQYEVKVAAQNNSLVWNNSNPITLYVVEVRPTVIAVTLTPPAGAAGGTPAALNTATPVPSCCFPTSPCCAPAPPTCHDKATFVADVNVPDGTWFDKGVAFDKTWRLRNSGKCTWDTRYQLVFVGGEQLGGASPTALPYSVAPGGTLEITVHMVAPNMPGNYRSEWQLRDPAGRKFGTRVYALIQVRPGAGDLPVITRFEVIPNSVKQGQSATLHWETINGTSARLYPGDQSLALNGSLIVAPTATTSYRLVVGNPTGSVERTATLIVRPAPATQPPPSPANLAIAATNRDGFDLTWIDSSSDEQGFRLYNADTAQVLATFGPNTTRGTIRGLTCGVSYRLYLAAFNESGESWPSNTVQGTAGACG
jgi:hypothetical protein